MLARGATSLLAICIGSAWPTQTLAQSVIVTDGTVGAAVALDGLDVEIPAELGQTRGGNLFHSFERFNVDTGASATFTGPDGLNNVISRVTGGAISAIDGTLASRIEGADVWLINPAGVLFGPDARLNVPAGFHVSTANELRFGDGSVFSATDPTGSTLTIADPVSFGFLGDAPGPIGLFRASLELRSEQSLSLVGGDIGILGNGDSSLQARDGSIRLAAVEGTGAVALDTSDPPALEGRAITLLEQASISTAGTRGGPIVIDGGAIAIRERSEIETVRFGEGISDNNVTLRGERITLDASEISTRTLGDGDAGDLNVETAQFDVINGAVLESKTSSAGDAGTIRIRAEAISIIGNQASVDTGIDASAGPGSNGNAGTIHINTESLELREGGAIESGTTTAGQAGTIRIDAGSVLIEQGDTISQTGLFTDAGLNAAGNAGRIEVHADELTIKDGGSIASETNGSADAGTVQIVVDALLLDGMFGVGTAIRADARSSSQGQGGQIQIRAGSIDVLRGGAIRAQTSAGGSAGRIDIVADRLTLDAEDDSVTNISVSTAPNSTGAGGRMVLDIGELDIRSGATLTGGTSGIGRAGTIIVTADQLQIDQEGADGQTGILSQTGFNASGGGGLIQVTADDMQLFGNGQIGTSTFGNGNAGSIVIDAGNLLSDGQGVGTGGINSTSSLSSGGSSGAIDIHADHIELRDGGSINTSLFGQGDSQDISIVTGSLTIDSTNGSALTAVSSSTGSGTVGDAGDISVRANSISILGDGQIDSDTSGAGRGGTIKIVADDILLDGRNTNLLAGILSESGSDATGAGGVIDITAGSLEIRNGIRIASRTFSVASAGQVRITAGNLIVDGVNGSDTGISSEANTSGGAAGRIDISADALDLRRGGNISSSTFGGGNAGEVAINGGTIRLTGQSTIESSSLLAGGSAGDIRIFANQILAQDSSIRTTGAGAAGGRIDTTARQAIRFSNSEITTSGTLPAPGSSILTLTAPFIEILAASRMLSLAGDTPASPAVGIRTGAARVAGIITVISDDSEIAASTDVDVQGLDADFDSGLQLSEATPIDIDRLLSAACAIQGDSDATSSFARAQQAQPNSPTGMLLSVSPAETTSEAC